MNVPAWCPKLALTAKDMLLWEEYLLARGKFQGDDPGIEWLRADSLKREGGMMKVKELRGLTPAGQPVILEKDEVLEIPVQEGEHVLFLAVHRWTELKEPDPPATQKYRLIWMLPGEAGGEAPHLLHLGTWKNEGVHSTLVEPPLPRRLQSVSPLLTGPSLNWEAWLKPFLVGVRELEGQTLREEIESTGATVLLSELRKLCEQSPGTIHECPAAKDPPQPFQASGLPGQLLGLLKRQKQRQEQNLIPADHYSVSKEAGDLNIYHLNFTNQNLKPLWVFLRCKAQPSVFFPTLVGISDWEEKDGYFTGAIKRENVQRALTNTWRIIFAGQEDGSESLDIKIYC